MNKGSLGEDLACELLRQNGYQILTRNFRSYFGEIDIIAKEEDTLVFVEVKTRWSEAYGRPEEAISRKKIASIIKTGQFYKNVHPELPDSLRLDAVVIEMENGKLKRKEIIKNLSQG